MCLSDRGDDDPEVSRDRGKGRQHSENACKKLWIKNPRSEWAGRRTLFGGGFAA
jgi:hypothetical protein